ncbi:galactokinase, putative [Phytophthora infestans T30-4]|uniref:Galactokinase, putative n=2 Tax=Phytophthora infestans TaxID=4787 RepID=D0NNS7_PHYIT|nr:galactokinase, putative [Phytophthora infestans T30-4]EEY62248.1 galactokinase, putative [Phytophthora infestans T30-4]|eukprot:XP_002899279.1 galactokinase, putative [Phytophthora infestans T30-4]
MAGSDTVDVIEQAVSLFYSTFKQHANAPREALTIAAAPGRVNLIGEHTDYNDGFVCPLALDKTTVVVGIRAPAESASTTKLASASFPDQLVEFSADNTEQLDKTQPSWGNYPKGVTAEYLKHLNRKEPLGVHAVIASTVPLGSGLSSSAALEVGFASFLESLFEISEVSAIQKALLCQAAEHEYCNVPCGIMDQFISSCGRKDCALLIDCRTKEPTHVAFRDPDVVIVVCNSNVKHELNGGEYKERVTQCQAAVKTLQTHGHPQMTHLRDATMAELDAVHEALGDEVVYRRARHVITENKRTAAAVEHIRARQYAEVGQLMYQSHESLRDDYEVSTPELDYLVETARGCEGVFGARMTGAGFGGCIIALVHQQHAQRLMDTLDVDYPADRFSSVRSKPSSFLTRTGGGAHVVQAGVSITAST